MLVITGPTGNVGAELVELLARQSIGEPWRIAGRNPGTLLLSDPDGATPEVVEFDFFDRSTWGPVLAGVQSLFLLFPLPGNRAAREAIIPFLHAARDAGCQHVVYVSVFGADRARFIPHHTVEAALRTSAMSHTVLRCSFFMQNLHRHVSTHGVDIAERGEVFIPAGRRSTTSTRSLKDASAVTPARANLPTQIRLHHGSGQLVVNRHRDGLSTASAITGDPCVIPGNDTPTDLLMSVEGG